MARWRVNSAATSQYAIDFGNVLLGILIAVVALNIRNLYWATEAIAELEERRDHAVPAYMGSGHDNELLDHALHEQGLTPELRAQRDAWLDSLLAPTADDSHAKDYEWEAHDSVPLEYQDMPIP